VAVSLISFFLIFFMLELENSKKKHNNFTLLSDTFCAFHQQAGEGEADKMVYSISTETEIQGMG